VKSVRGYCKPTGSNLTGVNKVQTFAKGLVQGDGRYKITRLSKS
jgi:hypothetical protein